VGAVHAARARGRRGSWPRRASRCSPTSSPRGTARPSWSPRRSGGGPWSSCSGGSPSSPSMSSRTA
jgi:hypothetical protein